MSKKKLIELAGKTEDGRPIFKGLFRFYETYGLPLDVVLDFFRKNNAGMDVIDFYQDAVKSGIAPDKVRNWLEEALLDSGCDREIVTKNMTIIDYAIANGWMNKG